MLFVFIFNFLNILSCSNPDATASVEELLKADRDFSQMSLEKGMFSAFLSFIAEDGVILRDNSFPSKGREALRERFDGKSDTSFVLTWEPLSGKMSGSGDLGYTYGIHTTLIKATGELSKGTYVTVWQRQADGSWKFVLDTGTEGLPDSAAVSGLPAPGKRSENSKN